MHLYIRIEAEGYNDWEQTFCPKGNGLIDVEIDLMPKYPPLEKKQET